MQLDRFRAFSAALDEIDLSEIKRVFPHPSLIEIKGENPQPLFISTLLHGNETTSFEVLKHLRTSYANKQPPRSLLIFVGNVDAAEAGLRFLDGQPDYNRIWAGGDTPHHKLAREVTRIAQDADIFASIDIHNNTGSNPLYGCVSVQRAADLHLAAMFAPRGVYYRNPPTTLSIAFSSFCPSITLECAKPGDPIGVAAAIKLIEDTMRLEQFPEHPPAGDQLTMYETIGRVLVSPEASIEFGNAEADIVFPADFDTHNFQALSAGTHWAKARAPVPLVVLDELGHDLTGNFFERDGENLKLARDIVPAMITTDRDVIAKDCLCYLMVPH